MCGYEKPRLPEYDTEAASEKAQERYVYIADQVFSKITKLAVSTSAGESRALIVNGNETSAVTGKGQRAVSGLATRTSAMMGAISNQSRALPLVILCDDVPGLSSTDIALFLLAGLFDMGTDTMTVPFLKEKPSYREILTMITNCVRAQQQKSAVWLVVDCIDSIEDMDRREGTLALFKTLLQLTKDQSQWFPFTLLVTSGTDGECIKYARAQKLDLFDCPRKLPKSARIS